MAIAQLLAQILAAQYGRDVRQSIHDAIGECYDDVSTAKTLATDATNSANTAATNANEKATLANTKAGLADTAAIIDFVVRTKETAIMESMQMILEKLNVLEYIVTEKLEIDADTMESYSKEYGEKFEAFLAEMQAGFADVDSYEIEAMSDAAEAQSLTEGY